MDDEKFIDTSIALFESSDRCENIYFVYLPEYKSSPLYIKSQKITIIRSKNDILEILSSIEKIDGIIMHYYDDQKAETLIELKKRYPKAKAIWFAWGKDFYQAIDYPLYNKKTKQLLRKKQWIRSIIKTLVKPLLKYRYEKGVWYSAIPLIDYCSPVLPNEFSQIKKLKGFRAQQILYSYLEPETIDFLKNKIQNIQLGDNILIGNSATPTNNHLDIFQKIKEEKLPGKLIVPLSYGEPIWYKDIIIEKGNLLFGKYFYPLIDFMQIEDYIDLISSCNVVIYDHYRQQGMGNISTMLYFGARVYLSEKSIAYQYYKALGVHVYSLEKDFTKYKFSKLGVEKIIENREIMNNNIYNKEILVNILNGILQVLEN